MSLSAGRVGVRADQVDAHGRVISPSFLNEIMENLPVWTDLPVRVNGTEQLIPSNPSVPVTSPILTDIDYPDIRRNDQYFTYRESPTTVDGLAKIKSIKGNTLVWNQLVQNGNFADTSGWIGGNATKTASNNILSATLQAITPANQISRSSFRVPTGHKHLAICDINSPKQTTCRFQYDSVATGIQNINVPANTWTSVANIFEQTGTSSILLYFCVSPSSLAVNDVIQFRNFMLFDLTAMFGSTKADEILAMETAQTGSGVAYFRSLFPLDYYQYDSGSLLSFNGTGIRTGNADENILSSTADLPTLTYFPTGMKSAGDTYDELIPTKAITRISSVDLGTLVWNVDRNRLGVVYSASLVASAKENGGIMTAEYSWRNESVPSPGQIANFNKLISLVASYGGRYVYIIDHDFDNMTASEVKTALSGKIAFYELATPVELPTLSFE